MLQQPFNEIKNLWAEVRRLRGKVDRIAAGGVLITNSTSSNPTIPAAVDGSMIRGNATPGWERLAASVPAANVRNVVGLDNGDARPSWKTALDATNPVTQAFSDAASPGTSLVFSHRDHKHGMPANPGISFAAHAQITAASDTITPSAVIMTLTADGDYTFSSTPTISNGSDGQLLILINVDTTNILTFQDQGTLANSGLRLAANTIVLNPRDSIMLVYLSLIHI